MAATLNLSTNCGIPFEFTAVTFLYGSYFSEQLFYPEELFEIKISKKELIFQSRYFCTVSTFFRKATFWKKLISQKNNILQYILTFSGELSF